MYKRNIEEMAKQLAGNHLRNFLFLDNLPRVTNAMEWGFFPILSGKFDSVQLINAQYILYSLWVFLTLPSLESPSLKDAYHIPYQQGGQPAEGIYIRVYQHGEITPAFRALHEYWCKELDSICADPERLAMLDDYHFRTQWPVYMRQIADEFDGEHYPFTDGEIRWFITLRGVEDISGISRLFLRYDAQKHWNPNTGIFNVAAFIFDITYRIPFEEMFFACPEVMPAISGELAALN